MRIKFKDKIYRLKEIESGVDSLMELVEEPKHKYKEGDFLTTVSGGCFILKNICGSKVYDHAFLGEYGLDWDNGYCCYLDDIAGYCTPEEILKVIAALKKDGKMWSKDKKCIEDIPKRKFKAGDKVRIKDGISSKTHCTMNLSFVEEMDKLIVRELIVENCSKSDFVKCDGYYFSEDWLEPWSDEPKVGDWVIFWDNSPKVAKVGILTDIRSDSRCKYCIDGGVYWMHAVKWEGTKKHIKKVRKGEI